MENLSLFFAFLAGLLSFFSPCVFPLVPAYVAHLTGAIVKDNRVHAEKGLLFVRSISFILGFSVIFVLLGASASFAGQLFADHRDLITKLGGLLIVVFGLQMAGLLNLRLLMRNVSWDVKPNKKKGFFSSFVLGLAFGTGWSPCVGFALGAILVMASSTETMYTGMWLLFVYSMGLGVPFLVISLIVTKSIAMMKKMNRFIPILSKVSGWLLVLMGILLFTGQLQKLSAWLSQFTPML